MDYLNGMPCHKYIIRKLSTDSEILEFERAFIDALTGVGVSDSEISTSLTLMEQHILPGSPIAGKHFDIDGNVSMGDFINNVRFDNEISSHKNCRGYYRKYDNHYTACKACPHSSIYKNGNLDQEHKIARFMVSSKENLLYIKDKVKPAEFESVYDIMEYAIVQRPVLFPLYRNICEFYFSKDRGEADFSDEKITETLLDDLISKLKIQRPPKEFMSEGWDKRYGGYLSDILYEIPCPSKKQVDEAIEKLHAFRKKEKEEKKKKKKADIPAPDTKEPPVYQQTIESIVLPEQKDEKKDGPADDDKSSAGSCRADSDPGTMIVLYDKTVNSNAGQSSTGNAREENRQDQKDVDDIEIIEDIDSLGEYVTVESEDKAEYTEPGGYKIPYHPSVFMDEMEASAICLDRCSAITAATFEKTACSDGRVCVECVFTETEELYLLFYIRGLRKFFYTSLQNKSSGCEAAMSVLQRDGVEKICYSPFMLHGFVRHMGGFIRNLYAIESAAALLEEQCGSGLLVYAKDVKARQASPGEDFDSEYEVISPVFLYMTSYYWMKVTQSKKIQKRDVKDQEIQLKLFDEAAGTGYLTASYLYSEGYSLQLLKPGVYQFKSDFIQKPKKKGRFIDYELTSEMQDKIRLLRLVCCNLADKGILRRYKINLMQIYKNGVEFFIEEQDTAFAMTAISVEFLNVFGENMIRRVELQTTYLTEEDMKGESVNLLSLEDRNRAKQMRTYKEQAMQDTKQENEESGKTAEADQS